MNDGKVVFLAFSNPTMKAGSVERLACGTCNNKTYVVTYDTSSGFPTLGCACCGADCGRIGWAQEEA